MEIQQQQQTIAGHQVNVAQMHGNFGQVGDNFYYADESQEPPSLATVRAYLEHIPKALDPSDVQKFAREAGIPPDKLAHLWNQAFMAHPPGNSTPVDLGVAVRQSLQQSEAFWPVVLLAEPGMGKTPALRHLLAEQADEAVRLIAALADEEAEAVLAATDAAPAGPGTKRKKRSTIPLLVDLAYLSGGTSLEHLLADAFNQHLPPGEEGVTPIGARQVQAFLHKYRCLFLLDGLDFLILNQESGGVARLRHFMLVHQREGHQYLLTCRTSSYREQLGTAATLILDDLTAEQVQHVIPETYEELNSSLQELVRNRAMLTLVLEILGSQSNEGGPGAEAAQLQNKGRLLSWQMQKRLDQAGSEGVVDEVPLPVLRGALAQLAYAMQRDHTYRYSEEKVRDLLYEYLTAWRESVEWRAVLDALEHSSFLAYDQEQGEWRFCHARDQAFWAARAIYARPERVHALLAEAGEYWWRETIDILVGLLPEPAAFFFALMDRHPLTAASSIQYAGPAASGRVTNAVIDALVEAMGRESSFRRKQIIERMAESNHPRTTEALFLALHKEWSSLPLKALAHALALRAQGREDTEKFLLAAEEPALQRLRNRPVPVANIVAAYIRARDGDGGETEKLAADMSHPQGDPRRRGLAAIYIGLLAAEGHTDWQPLIELFGQGDVNSFVPWCVVQALTDCREEAVRALAVRLTTGLPVANEKSQEQRARAVYLLGWIGSHGNSAEVLAEALADDDPLVRGFAVDALTRLNYPDTRERIQLLLAQRTQPESDPEVLRRMAEAMGQIGTVESIPVLQGHLHHERARTRRAMQKAISDIRQRYGLWEAPVLPVYWR